jgi:hypothetical protein
MNSERPGPRRSRAGRGRGCSTDLCAVSKSSPTGWFTTPVRIAFTKGLMRHWHGDIAIDTTAAPSWTRPHTRRRSSRSRQRRASSTLRTPAVARPTPQVGRRSPCRRCPSVNGPSAATSLPSPCRHTRCPACGRTCPGRARPGPWPTRRCGPTSKEGTDASSRSTRPRTPARSGNLAEGSPRASWRRPGGRREVLIPYPAVPGASEPAGGAMGHSPRPGARTTLCVPTTPETARSRPDGDRLIGISRTIPGLTRERPHAWTCGDLNPRPPRCERGALPDCATGPCNE